MISFVGTTYMIILLYFMSETILEPRRISNFIDELGLWSQSFQVWSKVALGT
jgi:hypothetical protein